ncbi:MAG TPA: hypothetical protein VJ499_07440 [Flavisolibacter sp.]|nr:hypothetical protein [Flavisolibacter sp.]
MVTYLPIVQLLKNLANIWFYNGNIYNMIINENNSMPYMKSLANCLTHMVNDGYTEDFTITEEGLRSIQHLNNYLPEEIQVVNFYRFEGESDPDDNAILYIIETVDGTKGTLVDSYGTYNDSRISNFMKNVETIKKTVKN